MPTKPKEVYELVKTRLDALGIQGLSQGWGPEEHGRSHSAPRAVWLKSTGAILPTDSPGGNPRAIARRRVRVQAHLWGQTDEQAEQLLEQTIVAVEAVAPGVYKPVEETWPLHDKPKSNPQGAYVVLTFEVNLYVYAAPKTTVKVKAVEFDPSGAVPGDGVMQAGET
jgi:hypothetical protein